MSEMAMATRMALTRCAQHQHVALALLAACLDNSACALDRTTLDACIGAVAAAQAVVRRVLADGPVTGPQSPC